MITQRKKGGGGRADRQWKEAGTKAHRAQESGNLWCLQSLSEIIIVEKNFKMLEHQEVFPKKSQAMDLGHFLYGAANLLPRVKTVHRW